MTAEGYQRKKNPTRSGNPAHGIGLIRETLKLARERTDVEPKLLGPSLLVTFSKDPDRKKNPDETVVVSVREVNYPLTTSKSVYAELDEYKGQDVNGILWNPAHEWEQIDTSDDPTLPRSDGADFPIRMRWVKPGHRYRVTIKAEFRETGKPVAETMNLVTERIFYINTSGDPIILPKENLSLE